MGMEKYKVKKLRIQLNWKRKGSFEVKEKFRNMRSPHEILL